MLPRAPVDAGKRCRYNAVGGREHYESRVLFFPLSRSISHVVVVASWPHGTRPHLSTSTQAMAALGGGVRGVCLTRPAARSGAQDKQAIRGASLRPRPSVVRKLRCDY